MKAERNQRADYEERDRRIEIMAELREAAALADGAPWRGGGTSNSHAGMQLTEAARAISEMPLKETISGMAELEIALDDRGWKRLLASSQFEFSRFGIQSIILICRLHRIKNPLAARAVDVSAFYVFGRGLEISSPDETANETLQDFFNDPRNASQFSHTALVKKEKATYTDGNLFFAFFSDPQDGRLESRGLDAVEISDIICDPNDNDTPWFYRRDWTENTFDPKTGRREMKQRTQWYFALGYEDIPGFPANQRRIESDIDNVALDSNGQPIPVLHLKDGDLPGWRFGCPRMYSALDWLRAYKRGLEDLCTLWRALSRFAWNVETEGGAPAIAAFKQVLATTLGNDLTQIESNPPPVTGSAFISGPTNKISPMQTGGATTMNPDNLRRVLLMAIAGFGLNENMIGDACYSADTEVLTDQGFMLHQDWHPGIRVACYNPETERIEWREPFELHTYFRDEPLIHFCNGQTDIAVTPNHRMWASPVVGWNAKNPVVDRSWRIETADFLAQEHREKGWKFKVRFDIEESHGQVPDFIPIKSAVNWAAFIGYWVSEGCTIEWTGANGHTLVDGTPGVATIRRVMLSQNEGPVFEDMKSTLRALGIHFYAAVVKGKQRSIAIYNKPLWDYLRATCGMGCHSKRLPRELLNAPEPVRRALYNAMMAGDGGKSGSSFRYSSTSKQLADDMQVLATTLGFAANITVESRDTNPNHFPISRVWIRTEWTESSVVKPKHISHEPYCGLVYCFNLPHGIYVTRRAGKIAIQGNSTGSYATANSLQRDIELMFRERQEVWTEVLQRIGRYVLSRSLSAPKGKLRESVAKRQDCSTTEVRLDEVAIVSPPGLHGDGIARASESNSVATDKAQKITVSVTFPAILQGDLESRINAIVEALTLNGKEVVGIDQKVGFRLLLVELGVEDPDIVIEAMFPEATYEIDRTLEPEPPTMIRADAVDPISDKADLAGQQQEPLNIASQDKAVVDRAVNEILKTARKRLEQRMKETTA